MDRSSHCAWDRDVLETFDQVVRLELLVPDGRDRDPVYAHLADESSMAKRYRVIDRGTLGACELRRDQQRGS